MTGARRFGVSSSVLAGAVALVTSAALLAAGALGGDEPAHLYRTLLAERGIHVWDNLWYAGHYLPSYSLLYHPLAAVVGTAPLAVAGVVLSAVLFAAVSRREWPEAGAGPWLAFAVLAPSSLVTGTYPYAAGLAALLGALAALQRGRRLLALVAAALTLAFSALAFALLCLALLAVPLARRRLSTPDLAVGGGVLALVGVAAVAAITFGVGGDLSFPFAALAAAATVGGLTAALAWRAPARRPLAFFALLWVGANGVAFVVGTPVGPNLTRLRFVFFALALAAGAAAAYRPRWLAAIALGSAFAYSVVPVLPRVAPAMHAKSDSARFWDSAIRVLKEQSGPAHRIEVVPTAAHWESYYLPRAGLPLVRGWYRQDDRSLNAILYADEISPSDYRTWLRRVAARHVLLPHLALDTRGSDAEASLLRSGRSGLVEVARTDDWTLYELPDATPILAGPAPSRITHLGHDQLSGWAGAGTSRLAIRFTPLWQVDGGGVRLSPADDGMTLVHATEPGPFRLSIADTPGELLSRWWKGT